jgi:hypothetical protein
MTTKTHQQTATAIDAPLPKITFRVTKEFRKRLKVFAADRETSVEDLCKDAVTKFMESADGKVRVRAS